MKSINQLTNQFTGPAPQAFFPETATNVAAPVCGLDAVSALGCEHGIVISHLAILAALAEELDIVFAFRPVNPLATQLIEQGYPTKDLSIKGKSANWGPMAGFVPVLQELSKLAGKPAEIDKSNASVQDCIADGHAVAQPLTIDMARLNALHRLGV
ncbi:MAG: adenylate cyclase, partial [Herminiimonas sp.]|nr:adenylate cyclase [Herminiimonas sp.]